MLLTGLKVKLQDKEQSGGDKSALYELNNFLDMLQIDVTDTFYKNHYLERIFNGEFSQSINSIYQASEEGSLSVEIDEHQNQVVFKGNKLFHDKTSVEHYKHQGAIYLDNPFVLDELSYNSGVLRSRYAKLPLNHLNYLKSLLVITWLEENLFNHYLYNNKCKEIFSDVVKGDVKVKSNRVVYEGEREGVTIPVQNLATGMKSFSILKMLIESGILSKQDVLILDEPEVHLHPSWQLRYAELIVLISIEFNLKVLVTSHSPYFVEALELYAKKHKIEQRVHYYQAQSPEKRNTLKDVTDNLPKLYEEFAEPFVQLEELRDIYD